MIEVLVQDAAGNRRLFTCNQQRQLCYQTESGRREVLLPDISGEFDVITGADGCIHLTAQDIHGTLLYLCYDGETWRKYPILHNKSGEQSITQIHLLHDGSYIHAFYILQHQGRHMLVSHVFGAGGSPSAPQPIGYVHPTRRYCAAADGRQTCHIFFFDEDSILQYRQFHLPDHTCHIAEPPMTGQIRAVSAICDHTGILHTAYLSQQKQYYTISYCHTGAAPKLLSFGVDNIAALTVVVTDKQITVQWQERYNVYECASRNGGLSFSKPRNLSATKGSGTRLIHVRQPANPWGLAVDQCACIGTTPLGGNGLFSMPVSSPPMPLQQHTAQTQWQSSDTLAALQVQVSETRAEVAHLQQIVNRLISSQTAPARPSPPPEAVLDNPKPEPKTEIDPDSVGEIDQENYKLFQQMTVEDLDFSAGQTF